MENRIRVYNTETGKIGTVPSQNLQVALSKGFQLYEEQNQNNQNNRIRVYNPETGKLGTVPAENLDLAKSKGYQLYEEQNQSPNIGNRLASAAKSVFSGVAGAIPDTLSMPYNIAAGAFNYAKANNMPAGDPELINPAEINQNTPDIPYIPSFTNSVDQKIDSITQGYTKTPEDQKYLNTALEAGSSFASGGALGKIPGIIGKIGKVAGNTSSSQALGAGVGAAVTQNQLDQGASVGGAIGSGIGANIATNAISSINPRNIGRQLAKTGLNAVGLGEKNLNLEAAKAFKDLNLGDIPKASVSNAKSLGLAEQLLSKMPIAGEYLQGKYYKVGNKVTEILDKALDTIEPGTIAEIKDLSLKNRNKAIEILKDTDATKPTKLLNTINKIESEIKLVASPTPQEKQVINIIDDYKKAFEGKDKVSVKSLILSQDSLGNIVDWNWAKKEKALRWQGQLYKAFGEDIKEYGNSNNLEWLGFYKKADDLYSKASKKEGLLKLFEPSINKATGEYSFNNLSKILNDDKKVGQLKYLLGTDEEAKTIFNKLEKLGKVARSIAVKNKNIPNPSGTAIVNANLQFLDKILIGAGGAGFIAAPAQTSAIAGGAVIITKLLTSEKLLDLAIRFAENPTTKTAVPFSNIVKKLTGYNIISSFKEVQKENTKTENMKETTPGRGLSDFLETIHNNKPIRTFLEANS